MKKHWLMSAAMLTLISAGAIAADDTTAPATTGRHYHAPKTLEEARKAAHERADKLDKMTEDEWNQKQAKRKAWKAKWNAMTPEEKDAYKKSHHRHKADTAGAESSATTTSPTAASTAAAPEAPPAAPAVPAMPATIAPPPAASVPSAPASPTAPAEMTAPPMAAPSSPGAR